ncbi:MAG: pilus assembly protein PilM [Candidatus Omnitrophota bacterium]|nr:pilus assembly protein PilM [Candidatus Omnitrophota bacterium]
MARKIGLYVGLSSVGAVAVENKKIISSARFDLASLEEEAKVENLSEEVRWEALINKTLREVGAEEKNIYVSLADKDFIFRSLEMPLMDKKNIGPALTYEIERYIPFKIDELWWDYSFIRYPKEKKMNVSFVGIRESTLFRTQEILSHLGLNPVIIEPSSLSLVKVVKSAKKFSQIKNFAVLDITEAESYLTFFNQDLPVFNQYIVVPKKDEGIDSDKFIESVRFAFQYFKREFRDYDLERLVVVSNLRDEKLSPILKEELQVEAELFSPLDVTTNPNIDLESIKAFGAATSVESSYKFKPTLKKTEVYKEETERKKDMAIEVPALRLGLLFSLAGIGVIALVFLSVFLSNDEAVSKYEIKKQDESLSRPEAIKGLSWKKIESAIKEQEKRIKELKELGKTPAISSSLDKIAALRPEGLWFESIYGGCDRNKCTISIDGNIFVGDPYRERAGIDSFISSVKNDKVIKEKFSNIEMTVAEKRTIGRYSVTHFIIKME